MLESTPSAALDADFKRPLAAPAAWPEAVEVACALLKVLANPDRLRIVCQLVQGPMCVGRLERVLHIEQPTLSQQLTVLRAAGVVQTTRRGKYIDYRLHSPQARAVLATLYAQFCANQQQDDPISKESAS